MDNKLKNLGDYNTVRIMLQEKNGDLSKLIKEFKDIGALEALPKQVGFGILIGASICAGGTYVIKKVTGHIKKQAKEREKRLEEGLESALTTDIEEINSEELPCS